ncbi:MAG TPA: hypothetical protein PKX17_01690 [Candidatus Methanomethylicus sp.]|nr:hypothetical protein [Candidatus Methanomethylicus sp.]
MRAMLNKIKGIWTYAMAASAAPLAYLLSAPCGAACGACPMGGACILSLPAIMAVVFIAKFSRKIKKVFARALS